jgi:hypothetical protein
MLLSILMVPVTITCYDKSPINPKIQQLKEARLQKGFELSDLGTKIAKEQDLIETITYDIGIYLSELTPSSKFTENEQEEFLMKLCESLSLVIHDFEHKVNTQKNINGMLTKIFFDKKKSCPQDFDKVKFLLVRRLLENNLLRKLIEKYEECLQEFMEIDHELDLLLGLQIPD